MMLCHGNGAGHGIRIAAPQLQNDGALLRQHGDVAAMDHSLIHQHFRIKQNMLRQHPVKNPRPAMGIGHHGRYSVREHATVAYEIRFLYTFHVDKFQEKPQQ